MKDVLSVNDALGADSAGACLNCEPVHTLDLAVWSGLKLAKSSTHNFPDPWKLITDSQHLLLLA